jgi:hypothetical protein
MRLDKPNFFPGSRGFETVSQSTTPSVRQDPGDDDAGALIELAEQMEGNAPPEALNGR